MKKLFVYTLAVLGLGLFAAANAYTVTEKEMGFISVNSTAIKEVEPDTASIVFSVETTEKDSKDAVAQNKEITSKLILALKPLLAIEKDDVIQTKNFVLRPNYTYDKNNKKTFQNYSAVNTISVKTKNLDSVSKLIDTAVSNNASKVSELTFYVEDEAKYSNELAQTAINKAKETAMLTSQTLNQKLCGVRSVRVNVYQQNTYSSRNNVLTSAKGATNSSDSTPIEYGKINLQANVDAEFYVK